MDVTATLGASALVTAFAVSQNIGTLITNDAQFEVGATGQLHDAWVVFIDGRERLRVAHLQSEGWRPFRIGTGSEPGDHHTVRFEISAPNPAVTHASCTVTNRRVRRTDSTTAGESSG